MATILTFTPPRPDGMRSPRTDRADPCHIVIFPGVRIERHDVDLSFRLRDSIGRGDCRDIGGVTRKTS